MNYDNKYVPTHAEHLSLPWYERDGLMSYIDSLKCDQFKKNPEEHFNKTKIVSFAMIHAQTRVDKLDQKTVNDSRTIFENHLDGYKSKEKIASSAIKCGRIDLHVDKKLVKKHFKKLL